MWRHGDYLWTCVSNRAPFRMPDLRIASASLLETYRCAPGAFLTRFSVRSLYSCSRRRRASARICRAGFRFACSLVGGVSSASSDTLFFLFPHHSQTRTVAEIAIVIVRGTRKIQTCNSMTFNFLFFGGGVMGAYSYSSHGSTTSKSAEYLTL